MFSSANIGKKTKHISRFFWASSLRLLYTKFISLGLLHLMEKFENFLWHALRSLRLFSAVRFSNIGVPLRRVSVHRLLWPTPTIAFDDFYRIGFLRGRPSIFVLTSLFRFWVLAWFPRKYLTLFFCGAFLDSADLSDLYLGLRVSDQGV